MSDQDQPQTTAPGGLRPVMRFDRPREWPRLKALLDDAFGRADESRLIETLRADGDFAFLILAEIDAGFIGVCGFSRLTIDAERQLNGAVLAPLAVAGPFRGEGVASALVRAGIAQCRRRGLDLACVVGAPRFFERLGFSSAAAAEITSPWSGKETFQALPLRDDLATIAGEARFPKAFDALGPAAPI